jgi:hypothetical protein
MSEPDVSQPDDRPPKSVSEKKRAANRANAKKSTGPRTPQGKKRVSLNALTHGLTASTAVLPFENADHFEKFASALRADLRPSGFLQTLLAERVIDAAWKLRRASRAQTDLACRLLDEDLHQHKVVVENGAYVGPYTPLTGAGIVADAVETGGGAVPSAGFLKLDLYADRLQRAMLGALSRLRREQDRAAKAGETAASTDVEVELGVDKFEDAAMTNKATAGEEEDGEPLDLRVFIRDPYAKENAEEGGAADHSDSQNKATAGAEAPPAPAPSPTHHVNGNGDAPAAAGDSSAVDLQRDGEPWRDLPPWHPTRARAG